MLLLWLALSPSVSTVPLSFVAQLPERVITLYIGEKSDIRPSGDYMTLKEYFTAQSLDDNDALLYQHLFALHREKNWAELDRAASNLKRKDLMPWLIGERLADTTYTPTMVELAEWLAVNEHMPQAMRIQRRLARMDPEIAQAFDPLLGRAAKPSAPRPQPASMHTNMTPSQRSVMEGALRLFTSRHYGAAYEASSKLAQNAKKTLPGAWWIAGLSALHLDRPVESYKAFSMIAQWAAEESREEWLAQSNFWAHRLALKNGDAEVARRHLKLATKDRYSFYGLLANAKVNQSHALVTEQEDISTRHLREPVLQLIAMAAVLHDAGQQGEAKKLIKSIFSRVEPREQQALIWTASSLHMDDLQLPLASQMAVADMRSHYPMPAWSEKLDADPALVLAIVRRESGFDPNAGSHAGAQGLMQIIPSTYHYMVNKHSALDVQVADGKPSAYLSVAALKGGLRNPDVNLRVGQSYLRYLQAQPYIGQNLVYLIAAYNAGPGSLQAWADQMQSEDPLLFIESIPYRETRDYVKNVMTDYWVYSQLLERPYPALQTLSQSAWPTLPIQDSL
jgi:soluble lytic murein transglycosylase-like protein